MSETPLDYTIDDQQVATITMRRPEVGNAFDDHLIRLLTDHIQDADRDPLARVIVLRSEGKHFSAGADLNYMGRMAEFSEDENLEDSRKLGNLMRVLDGAQTPTVAVVQGAAIGGGVGLVACCDIAIAAEEAIFAFTEVRLGLVPAVISPFVVRAIGTRHARRFFLTAERFDAATALQIGLVHQVVPRASLNETAEACVDRLLKAGPVAVKEAKKLVATVSERPDTDELHDTLAQLIAELRASSEGQDGIGAFLEKRKPGWLEG